jgi:hypothetical protein
MAPLHHGIEHPQGALAEGIESTARTVIACQHFDEPRVLRLRAALPPVRIGQSLRHHRVMHAGVLAQVQRGEVKAERINARQQATHQEQARMHAAIGAHAVGNERDSAAKLRRPFVAVGPAFQRVVQARRNLPEQHPIGHRVVACGGESRCIGQQGAVVLDAPGQRRRDAHPAGALGQLIGQQPALEVVVADDRLLLARQRLADALGVQFGRAGHVPAYPGAEASQQRHLQHLGSRAI